MNNDSQHRFTNQATGQPQGTQAQPSSFVRPKATQSARPSATRSAQAQRPRAAAQQRRTPQQARATRSHLNSSASMPSLGGKGTNFSIASIRPFLPIAGVIIAIVLIVILVSSLLRSCSTQTVTPTETPTTSLAQTLAQNSGTAIEQTNAKATVGSLTTRAYTLLNHDTLIAKIADECTSVTSRKGLDEDDSRNGLYLTSRNEQAANYVYGLNKTNGEAISYAGSATKGKAPKLYQWDERWGYMEYCGMPLGFSGCGVTVMAMARMGLTGQADMDPADMAQLSIDEGEADGGTLSTFFTNYNVEQATGVAGERLESTNASLLTQYASDTSYVLVNVRANTLAGGGHWILVVGVNDDSTIEIRDPNSPANSAKSWDPSEIAGYATAYIVLHAA